MSPCIARSLLAIAILLALGCAPALAAPAAVTTPGNGVLLFDTANPGTITERRDITGIQPTEQIRGIDVRPATGQLYALGIVPGAMDTGRIYVVDPGTGVATQVGTAPFATDLDPAEYGFDFNPASDRIRVVNRLEENRRVHPDTGALVQTDAPLNPAGDVDAIAYDQNQPGTPQTTLWGYDSGVDKFVRIGDVNGAPASPNNGQVNVFTDPSGISTAGRAGMDISPANVAFLTAATAGPVHSLYQANLGAGAVTAIGAFPEAVDDIAVLQPSAFAFETSAPAVSEAVGSATVTVTRSGNTTGTQTVAYAATDGSAVASDYNSGTGVLTFAPGEATKTFAVAVTNDSADEPDETVALALSAPTGGATLGAPPTSTLTILDDDGPPEPADELAPALLLAAPTSVTQRQALRGVAGRVAASERCSGRLRLRLGKRTLGSRRLRPSGASVTRFRVKPGRKGRRTLSQRLRRSRTARLTLSAACTDPAGNRGSDRVRVKVQRG